MYIINISAGSVLSTKTICPPYHSNIAMTTIPKNSLVGEARFWRFKSELENLKRRFVDSLNLSLKIISALNPFIIFRPPRVSSKIERKKNLALSEPCQNELLNFFQLPK